MTDLSNTITSYYQTHFNDLPFDKQFHYASRRYLWSRDAFSQQMLTALRPTFTANDDPAAAVRAVLLAAQQSPQHGSKNASALRVPYFEQYPKLKQYVTVLFRIAFLETIYGLDARQTFGELFPLGEVETTIDALLADPAALAILSTHAVNFIYLYERFISQADTGFDPALFLQVGRSQYDKTDKIHLQLLIYLYTHCLIGESKFYYRAIPKSNLSTYQTMLDDLEVLITANYVDINLDNKCEFLVCCRFLQYESKLSSKIEQEAEQSLAHDGTFLIDRHNNNPQLANIDLASSEHRNVLYVMAQTSFRPLV